MIDNPDYQVETLKLLASQAIKNWSEEGLFKLLMDNDYVVRSMAARELQKRGDDSVFFQVKSLLENDSESLREVCAFILGQLGTPDVPFKEESIPILLQLTEDESIQVRVMATSSLGLICFEDMPPNVEERIVELAKDSNSDVRCSAAVSLGYVSENKQKARAILESLLDDKYVNESATLGLELLD